ncbi:MAG: LTA synthase family protein [Phycisphaerae bacterium]|nr:LTA synthase family protein [Phycisphaerae bacterium]
MPGRLYGLMAPRAYSVIMFGALFCTLAVKLFQAYRVSKMGEYFGWVLADIAFLFLAEIVLALIYFRWTRKWVYRLVTGLAAIICTWSVVYAGYLIRMGTEVVPRVLLPLVRDPVNAWRMIGGNLIKSPVASVVLLGPSFVVLAFLCSALAKPRLRVYDRRRFTVRVGVCLVIGLGAAFARPFVGNGTSAYGRSPHIRAVASLFRTRLEESRRRLPSFDEVELGLRAGRANQNVVIVILEGVQYAYTSLAGRGGASTPYLVSLAGQGVDFANTRSSATHTTKALFALLTGRYPSASEDLAEAVPAVKAYLSLATILSRRLGYRTAFFQSAKGDFESRPGLVHNLGFDKFWARDDLGDPNHFIYYLACDEFAMIEPITEWIKEDQKPFLLTILCSVTHDPYDVPEWYAERAKEPVERYRQTIEYTDAWLRELDARLSGLGLGANTIFCVVGDHGEAFGEHGLSGHDQIPYEEALRIPFCIRAPLLIEPGKKVTQAVSSIDLTPTLLELLGFETAVAGFDGVDALSAVGDRRRVYFCGWVREGPSGYLEGDRKFVYDPADQSVYFYDLAADPGELARVDLPQAEAEEIGESIVAWRKETVFQLGQNQRGRQIVFGRWLVRWRGRVFVRADYQGDI